ncbi:conserved hypothetical protein [Thiomonas sp. X19]|nr:conserved hypothetical protein [Thiomonas sp. X19]
MCVVPCFHLDLEIVDQAIHVHELVRTFQRANVLVIALAALVVEPDDTFTIHHVGQSVLERVGAGRNRLRQAPYHHLDKATFAQDVADSSDEFNLRLHVGHYANT